MTATPPTVDAPYAGPTDILDADSHVTELPGWLEAHADPAVRDRIRPLHLGGAGALADKAIADAVLDAVERCLTRFGLRRTSMTDIARELGVARTTLYRQVGSSRKRSRWSAPAGSTDSSTSSPASQPAASTPRRSWR